MVSTTELGTLVNPAGLEDPPASSNKDVIDLLGHSTHIVIPSSAMRVEALIPVAKNL